MADDILDVLTGGLLTNYLNKSLNIKGQRCAGLQMPHDRNGIGLLKNTGFIVFQYGKSKSEQYFWALQQEAVPDPDQCLKNSRF